MKRSPKNFVSRTLGLALALVALSGCSGAPGASSSATSGTPVQAPTQTPSTTSSSLAPVASSAPTSDVPAPATLTHAQAGLMKLDALKQLPAGHVQVNASGYPGASFHRGVFQNPDSFRAFADAAGLKEVPKVDWIREVVAFVVLDAQTNKLSVGGLKQDGGTATLSVRWSGIEPFYAGQTPYALAVVRLGQTDRLGFQLVPEGSAPAIDLGSVVVSSE
jgi:hypothetical protein